MVMAALEFAKFHAHAMKSSPNKADERTARALRALELPQRAILLSAGIAAAEPEAAGVEAAAQTTPIRSSALVKSC
jgi:hypothetical protein